MWNEIATIKIFFPTHVEKLSEICDKKIGDNEIQKNKGIRE